jgi:hypothetical protein
MWEPQPLATLRASTACTGIILPSLYLILFSDSVLQKYLVVDSKYFHLLDVTSAGMCQYALMANLSEVTFLSVQNVFKSSAYK